jgi:DNA-directed RNA polymerase subunit alpha
MAMTMFPINQFSIKTVSESETEGVFHIGPLPKGYGATIGNTYRRLLLSSIPGAAVTSVKIQGVEHEYTALSGLQDDVLTLILALKGVAVVSHSDEPIKLQLQVKGQKGSPRQVTAADIEKNSMVEIINPEYVLTTLADDKAQLNAEITIEKGLGYGLPNEDLRKEIGTIPVDSIFTPVRLVSVEVSNTRVGQQTDLDLLELRVVTSGAVTPSAALYQAAEIMVKVSEHLLQTANELLSDKSMKQVQNAMLPVRAETEATGEFKQALRVEDLNLSTRLTNALLNSGYEDLRQLEGLTEEEVSSIKGMGEKSYVELLTILKDNEIRLI